MKILISGATGFIGKSLTKKLLRAGHKVSVVVRPSTKIAELEKKVKVHVYDGDVQKLISFMKENKIDGVVHLASLFLINHKSEEASELVESNVLFSTVLLEAASKSNVKWFINTGSFWQHYKDKAYSPVNLYAATKQAFEVIAQYFMETCPINFVTIKLFATFGPNDTRSKVFTLWSKISKTGEKLDMSPGGQIIDITHIDNIVSGYMKVIGLVSKDKERKLSGNAFTIQSEKRLTLRKLAELFEKISKTKLLIQWGGRPYGPREVMIPWRKGKKVPGWKPLVSLEEGIKRTLGK